MRLLADAGSTKITWALQQVGVPVKCWSTPGFNPNYADLHLLDDMLCGMSGLPDEVEEVCYYGSGCGTEANRTSIRQVLRKHFPNAVVEVDTDMMGAARALFGNQPGIACILGTGANACLYDGHAIVEQAVSLGYLVGDEGSGCYIGRKLARAYFYDLMPEDLRTSFQQEYSLTLKDFIDRVYHQPEASKYLAGFTRFAGQHQDHPYIQQLVRSCFEDFTDAFLLRFEQARSLPIAFVGSVAWHFQGILKTVLEFHGLQLGKVMQSPLDSLE